MAKQSIPGCAPNQKERAAPCRGLAHAKSSRRFPSLRAIGGELDIPWRKLGRSIRQRTLKGSAYREPERTVRGLPLQTCRPDAPLECASRWPMRRVSASIASTYTVACGDLRMPASLLVHRSVRIEHHAPRRARRTAFVLKGSKITPGFLALWDSFLSNVRHLSRAFCRFLESDRISPHTSIASDFFFREGSSIRRNEPKADTFASQKC